jgi:hypothetical protein
MKNYLSILVILSAIALSSCSGSDLGSVHGGGAKVSLAEFNKISNGMTYSQVTSILGGEGNLQSEVGDAGTQFHTVSYGYDGEGSMGANAILMFQGGKLNMKTQFGLK